MTRTAPLSTLALLPAVALAACAGQGRADFAAAEPVLKKGCVQCHDSANFKQTVADTLAMDNARFDATAFPPEFFPEGLRPKTTEQLRALADPPDNHTIPADAPQHKAWLLHEMHELKNLLTEAVPPDFTTQQHFDDFALLGERGAWEGCEIGAKLDLGHQDDPEGMPPRWAPRLFELLGKDYAKITPVERQALRDYVDALLPGGLKACTPGGGEAS